MSGGEAAGARACPTCGAQVEAGAVRCPQCKQVFGDANRCGACGALAAANEVDGGKLVCAACGAPRTRLPGTVVDSSLADLLTQRARAAGLWGTFFRVGALGAAAVGVAMGGLQAAVDLGSPALTMVVFVLGAVGLFVLGGRSHARKVALLDQALERRLLSEVGQYPAGATAERVAARVSESAGQVDATLTALAKRGRLDLDVDDAGTIRYRVASEDLELEQATADRSKTTARR